MLFFVIITILLLGASLQEILKKTKYNRMLFFVFSFVLWFFSFIRWEVGTDWDSYYSIYEDSIYIDWYEWGFLWINRLVKYTVDNYSVLLAILGAILFYYQTKSIQKLSILPLTTLFILWGTNLGNVFFVRQSIAVAILLYSITQIEERRLIRFLLLIGGATLIHAASIAFLPAYWIYYRKFSFVQIALAFAGSIALASIGSTFIWGGIGDLLGGMYASKMEGYIEEGADMTYNEGMSAVDLYIRSIGGKLVLVVLFYLLMAKKYRERTRGMMNLFLFATIMLPITFSVSPTLNRMWTPYFQIQIFLMTFVVASMNRLSNKMICFVILLIMTIVRLYLKLFVDHGGEAYLPFHTIFS